MLSGCIAKKVNCEGVLRGCVQRGVEKTREDIGRTVGSEAVKTSTLTAAMRSIIDN